MLKKRTTCRICGSQLTDVLDLGEHHLVGYHREGSDVVTRKVPLVLCRCDGLKNENACGLVQLRHTTPPYLMYRHYYYQSSINDSMVRHLFELGTKAMTRAKLEPGDFILDIGCNDGTLLKHYVDNSPGCKVVGFDPAQNLAEEARKKSKAAVVADFFNAEAYFSSFSKKTKLITSIAMFYDLENPCSFVEDVSQILADDGIWVSEQAYLPLTLKQNACDSLCHEHVEFYSLSVFENLLERYGLEVIDVYLNDINGGSFQVYVAHRGSKEISSDAITRIAKLRIDEFNMYLDTDKPYLEFKERIEHNRKVVVEYLHEAQKKKQLVLAYGASTKGSVTLQYYGVDKTLVPYCADRNPVKWGSVIVGSDIPIISEEEARKMNPDYFLILPWHFVDNFLTREKVFLDRGGKFIMPMPVAKIIP